MKRYMGPIFALVLIFGVAGQADALMITGSFSGNVTSVTGSSVPIGTPATVSGTFSYDTDLAGSGSGTTLYRNYLDIPGSSLSLTITQGGTSKTWSGTAIDIAVWNNNSGRDRFDLRFTGPGTAFPSAFGNETVYIRFDDTTTPLDFTTSTALPTSLSDLNLAAITSATGMIQTYLGPGYWTSPESQRYAINFNVSLNSLGAGDPAAVPEPATMFLLGSGLIGIGAFVRRRFKK